jgi:hypothetical protein
MLKFGNEARVSAGRNIVARAGRQTGRSTASPVMLVVAVRRHCRVHRSSSVPRLPPACLSQAGQAGSQKENGAGRKTHAVTPKPVTQ